MRRIQTRYREVVESEGKRHALAGCLSALAVTVAWIPWALLDRRLPAVEAPLAPYVIGFFAVVAGGGGAIMGYAFARIQYRIYVGTRYTKAFVFFPGVSFLFLLPRLLRVTEGPPVLTSDLVWTGLSGIAQGALVVWLAERFRPAVSNHPK